MKRSRFSEGQIIGILREQEAGSKTADVCRKHGVSEAAFYKWKAKFGGMNVSEARRLRQLEDENARLKKLLADAMLDNAVLKDIATKKWCRLQQGGARWLRRVRRTTSASGGRVRSWGHRTICSKSYASGRVPHPVFWTQECCYAATFINALFQAVRASLGLRKPFFSISHSAL